jgi:hypothetical protein
MRSRRFTLSLAAALSGLTLLVAGAADAQRHQPKSESPSSSGGTAVRVEAPQHPSPPPPSRVAVPKSDPPPANVRDRNQREPQRDGVHDGRDHRDHGRSHYYYPYYRGPYSYHPWGWWGPWYGFYPPYPWGLGVYWYPEQVHEGMGALDLDLKPEEAEVYLDGYKIGVADNFDGWPRYLWLEEGTYDLVFHKDGFETLARQYSIYPGVIIDVEDRMERGEATLPEDLVARSSERREERLRRRAERGETAGPAAWRDRVESERAEMEDDGYVDARGEPARLRLRVTPSDAAIYLDGEFLGTGDELGGVRAGLIVDPGEHELQVTRPGYVTETETFTAEAGEEVEVEVELDAE